MMKLAVDAMGGDHAPAEIVAGAVAAAAQINGEIILVGREPDVRAELARHPTVPSNLTVRHAEQVVEMDESPRLALRQKAGSSVTVCVDLVRDGLADAAISAGNSGALMAAATMRLGTLPGVQRPAIAVFLPTPLGKRIVLDAGANVDCKPEHLAEWALMGSEYAEHALGISRPRIGVLSIGTEAGKGNELSLATHGLLAKMPINFIGNVEGDQILAGEVDVTVCDGFVGNVVLKVLEGTAMGLFGDLKSVLQGSLRGRLAALLLRPALRAVAAKYDYAEYGGALLLGTNGVCIVAHGRSDRRAMARAIVAGAQGVEAKVQEHMAEAFQRWNAAPTPAPSLSS
ncbi:MAG: phosphate acyltransferase PlsX [Armatimonadetes bacterium]|nr:phosphate acyltransferase PlsX [Armatimonadota bacterium]